MKKRAPIFLLISILCLSFLVFFFWWFVAPFPACHDNCLIKTFSVEKGESLGSIAQRLEKEKLIKNAWAFRLIVLTEGLAYKIQAGDFRLSTAMSPLEMAQRMTRGSNDRWVTLTEGLRREEIVEKLDSGLEGGDKEFKKEEFLELTKNLEGKLFPDTYLLPQDVDARRVVGILTGNFDEKTASLKVDQGALILASLVEREAKHPTDRPIVAGILLKRLANDWPLQVDATVQYAVASMSCRTQKVECKWWPGSLTQSDLKIKSPYNTYLTRGLPPAPIANPGLAAIEAVIHSQETVYWYYLSDQKGNMHYAKTSEEHLQNIALYLQE